jgi:hypothetical protein
MAGHVALREKELCTEFWKAVSWKNKMELEGSNRERTVHRILESSLLEDQHGTGRL